MHEEGRYQAEVTDAHDCQLLTPRETHATDARWPATSAPSRAAASVLIPIRRLAPDKAARGLLSELGR